MTYLVSLKDAVKPKLVKLPHTFDHKSLNSVLLDVFGDGIHAIENGVIFDFNPLKFIDPIAVTVFSNILEVLKKDNVRFEFRNCFDASEAVRFLKHAGFFAIYSDSAQAIKVEKRADVLSLNLLPHQESHQWLEYNFTPWMRRCANVSESGDGFATIKVCLTEIFNNTRDHSGSQICSVFGQYFQERNKLVLAISDFGWGIPFNVRKREESENGNNIENDSDCVMLALQAGYSTKSTPRNRGAGLDVLAQNVVRNNGTLLIRSNSGAVKVFGVDGVIKKHPIKSRDLSIFYPGTLIEVTIFTDKLERVEEKEEFVW